MSCKIFEKLKKGTFVRVFFSVYLLILLLPLAKASVVLNATDFIGFNISASEIARIVSGGLIVSGGWVNSTNAAFNQICLGGNCKTSWPSSSLVGGSGTANFIPIWTASDTLGNSIIYQSGGNVGIGTTTPTAKLTIGPQNANHLELQSANSAWGWKIETNDFLGGNVPLQIFRKNAGTYTEVMRITQGGNVGIGTTSPVKKLDVVGDINATGAVYSVNGYYIGTNQIITGARVLQNIASISQSLLPTADNTYDLGSSSLRWRDLWLSRNAYIAGNVGIGTTSPQAKLDVQGGLISIGERNSANSWSIPNSCGGNWLTGVRSGIWGKDYSGGCGDEWYIAWYPRSGESSTLEIAAKNDADDHIALMPSGNVGIGTRAPVAKLDVNGNLWVRTPSGTDTRFFNPVTGTWTHIPWTDGRIYLRSTGVWIDDGAPLYVSGNVGIGTTAPRSKFEVQDQSGISLFNVFRTTGSALGYGTIGIGFNLVRRPDGIWEARGDGANNAGAAIYGGIVTGRALNFVTVESTGAGTQTFTDSDINSKVRMVITGTGNVGIGTTAPTARLHVVGQTRIENNGANIQFVGSNHVYQEFYPQGVSAGRFALIGFGSAGTEILTIMNQRASRLDLGTNNAVRVSIDSAGNLGIGTTTPENSAGWNRVLDVYGGSHSRIITRTTNIRTAFTSHNTGYYGAPAGGVIGTETSHPLSFITGGSSRVTIDTSGNVGIGTTSPTQPLHIVRAGSASIGFNNTNIPSSYWSIGTWTSIDAFSITKPGVADIIFINGTPPYNVGIGTTNPAYKLHVVGDVMIDNGVLRWQNANPRIVTAWDTMDIYLDTDNNVVADVFRIWHNGPPGSATNLLTISHNGNVGIGTTAPNAKLDVNGRIIVNDGSTGTPAVGTYGSSGSRLILWPGSSTATPYQLGIASYTMWYGVPAGAIHAWYINTSEVMRINSNGNVGIGTTTPSSKLEVYNGDIEINDGQATGTYKIKGLRVFYAGDETQVSTTSTTPELKKQFTSVFDSTYGIKPSYVNVIARIWNGASGRTTYLNVTLEGCNGIILSATSTSATVVKGSISVATCPDGLYSAKVYLYTTSGGTAYNDLIEFYYVG